ncbi:MAG: porin family protein [Candidatus Saccharicenans sp.]|nr:porin family protein [Candidatus Saccharicenans sp.]
MRRKAMAFLLVLALAAAAYGAPVQTGFRLWGGLTLAKYEGLPFPQLGIPEIRYQNAWRTGVGFGAGVELGFSGIPLALILDLSYVEKGTNLGVYEIDNKIDTLPYRLGALSHSGLAKISRRGNWTPYLLAGYELAFITRHRGQPFGSGGPDLMSDTRKVDFGLVAGAGLEFRQKKASPFVEFRYYHGLTNLSLGTGSLEYFTSLKCRTMLLSAGLKFGK